MTTLENFKIWLDNNPHQKNKETEWNWNSFFAEAERVNFWGKWVKYWKRNDYFLTDKIAEVLSDFATEEVIKISINCLLTHCCSAEEYNEKLKTKLRQLEENKVRLENELTQEKQDHQQTKNNFANQLREIATIIFPSSTDISGAGFGDLKEQTERVKQEGNEKDREIKKLETKLNHQLSWKTKIKHAAIGGLLVLGSKETYNWYHRRESNLTQPLISYNNNSWLENVYTNIPFNEPEYKNLTNLLDLPQSYQAQKVNDILFSGLTDNLLDWETELTRLKINDLITQIPTKKSELKKIITETKNKFSKAEKYLLDQLLNEKHNSEKITELKEVLAEHKKAIEIILDKKQKLRDLEIHLEHLQANQLEAKIELQN